MSLSLRILLENCRENLQTHKSKAEGEKTKRSKTNIIRHATSLVLLCRMQKKTKQTKTLIFHYHLVGSAYVKNRVCDAQNAKENY